MRTRPLGKTGLVVSELSLGTWGLTGEPYGPLGDGDAARVVARALDIGLNLIDTADSYGGGKMEELLGDILRDHREMQVVTKVGTDRSTDPPRKRFDPAYLGVAVRRSLKRLRRERLEVCLLHHPTAQALADGSALEAMASLKKEGLVGAYGVAASDVESARAAVAGRAEVLAMAYNLFASADVHRLAGDLLVDKVGLLARSTLSYGLLAGQWAKDREFASSDHRAERWTRLELERRVGQLDAVRFLVKGDVLTLRGAAVRFVLANNLVSSAVLGPRTVTQLEQLVRETGGGPRYLPDGDLKELPRALEQVGIES